MDAFLVDPAENARCCPWHDLVVPLEFRRGWKRSLVGDHLLHNLPDVRRQILWIRDSAMWVNGRLIRRHATVKPFPSTLALGHE
jgi:hypothetical protein